MRYFSEVVGVVGGVNFCRGFAFSSIMGEGADRRDSARYRGILVILDSPFSASSVNALRGRVRLWRCVTSSAGKSFFVYG